MIARISAWLEYWLFNGPKPEKPLIRKPSRYRIKHFPHYGYQAQYWDGFMGWCAIDHNGITSCTEATSFTFSALFSSTLERAGERINRHSEGNWGEKVWEG